MQPSYKSTIPTIQSLRRTQRRAERHRRGAVAVMTQLMRGQALTLSYERGRRCWSLSGGQPVSDEIAKIVIQDHRVIGTGDALFRNMPAQTFRFIED